MCAPAALRRPPKIATAYHDAYPFLRVVSGHAIHQHVVEALIDTPGRDHHEPALLILHLRATDIVHQQIRQVNMVQDAFVSADKHAELVGS